jgi:aerotaxis receptor
MRSNLPVTQNEFQFDGRKTLVSVTDLKGRIVHCNPAFIEVSGFTSGELLGQSHNLVRHPDMPEEAFRDMWETIEARQPWTGLVKNRRKNGDHYWVQANATPMVDGDKITGFLSVRTVPDRKAVQEAETLYARMREEAANGRQRTVLHRGVVMRKGWVGKVQAWSKPSLLMQLIMLTLIASLVVLDSAWLGMPLWASALVVLFTGGISAFIVSRQAIEPMHSLVLDANQLAAGDLSHAVQVGASGQTGQLQRALMQMSLNLRTVVSDVREEIDSLAVSIREIAEGNQDLSERTESQASSLEQTAASMEQINSTVQQNAASTRRGTVLAQETIDITDRSNQAVNSVAESMGGISTSSKKITEIIHLIEGVAFQTNILALNAAVEAARAGDQGRGFAVVAGEVRSLAQRTTAAAKEIKQLITESSEQISKGEEQTDSAIERMQSVLSSVEKVGVVLGEISQASSEQTMGISQINEAVNQLDSLNQQNAAMVEELAATAKSLQSQVENVSQSMRLFRLKAGEKGISQTDAVELRRQHKAVSFA